MIRVLPPDNAQPVTVNNRLFTPVNGALQTVENTDGEALVRNGWINVAASKRLQPFSRADTTANRPSNPQIDDRFYDTTLSKAIVWAGANWRETYNGNAV